MAKRTRKTTTTTSSGNYSLVKVLSFIALALAAFAGLISFVLSLLLKCGVSITWGNRIVSICSLISQVSLLVAVGVAAWDYVKNKKTAYRAIYIVAIVLCILGLVGVGIGITL